MYTPETAVVRKGGRLISEVDKIVVTGLVNKLGAYLMDVILD